jgi:large subunit ribosomal protein L23
MLSGSLYNVIVSPFYSEKATLGVENQKYTFKVAKSADKGQIKGAVEEIFGVKVGKVSIINRLGKNKVFKGVRGKRNGFKKAIVTVLDGGMIDLSKVV